MPMIRSVVSLSLIDSTKSDTRADASCCGNFYGDRILREKEGMAESAIARLEMI